jgi:trans-aconitate methyltransferase
MSVQAIKPSDIEAILGDTISERLKKRLVDFDLRFTEITPQERDHYILEAVKALVNPDLKVSGEHRIEDWERGWGENLEEFCKTGNPDAAVPLYFGKYPIVRWRRHWVRPLNADHEYRLLCILVEYVIERYMADKSAIYEFGCGPGYHLLRARMINAKARLVGLDWATSSQKILNGMAERGIDQNLEGRRFDFYHPDETLEFLPNSAVYSVAALEQIGDRHKEFVNFLLNRKPEVVVHLEPIDELMDGNDLHDQLSVLYCRKRNYLKGYLSYLEQLENEGKLTIHRKQRTEYGSFFIEGHSLVVWSPDVTLERI